MSLASRAVLASLLAFLVASCASVSGPGGEPRFNPRSIESRNSLLPAAFEIAAGLRDFDERMELYARSIEMLGERGDSDGATAVVDYLAVLLENRQDEGREVSAEHFLILARANLLVDRPDQTTGALQQVFELLREISESERRGPLLLTAADIAFAGGEETYGVLQELVSAVLVTEDLPLRIRVLGRVARGYGEQGAGLAASTLAQQAIPAAESIDNPWLRGVAFSDVAYIFSVAGDQRSQEQYFRRVLRELELGRPAVSPEGAEEGLRAVENLLLLDAPVDALRVAELLPTGSIRARGIAAVGLYYGLQDDRPTAFVTFSRAVREASREVNAVEQAEVFRQVAENYLAIEEAQLAEIQAMSAVDALRGAPEDPRKPALLEELLPIYGRDGDLSEVDGLVDLLEEPIHRGELLAQAVDVTIELDRRVEAAGYLQRAEASASESRELSRELVVPLVGGLVRLSGIESALQFLQGVDSDSLVAWGLLAAARHHPPDESLSDEGELLLDELLAASRARRVAGVSG